MVQPLAMTAGAVTMSRVHPKFIREQVHVWHGVLKAGGGLGLRSSKVHGEDRRSRQIALLYPHWQPHLPCRPCCHQRTPPDSWALMDAKWNFDTA